MKKQNFQPHPQPQSCVDLGKYKFIPPSKLLKTKPPAINNANCNNSVASVSSTGHTITQSTTVTQNNVNKNKIVNSHFHSLIQSHNSNFEEPSVQQQVIIKSINMKVQENSRCLINLDNKQNLNKKKQQKMYRSISNPKLQTPNSQSSNSRHTMLSNKNPPIIDLQQNRQQQVQIEKLNQYIHELQKKQVTNKKQIALLTQENKTLQVKLSRSQSMISKKNKMLSSLHIKITELENFMHEKCEQHTLIVDSLKKVIESQVFKINQLKRKYNRLQKIRCSVGYSDPGAQQDDTSYQQSQESIHFMRPQITKKKTHQQQLKQGKSKTNYISQQKINTRSSNIKGKKQKQTITQEKDKLKKKSQQKVGQVIENIQKIQNQTPDFGARTPSCQKAHQNQLLIEKQEQLGSQQLQCSIEGDNDIDNANLTLSRISQSVQEDFQTSRENVNIQSNSQNNSIINKNNSTTNTVHTQINNHTQNNNSKNAADRQYTHQQLLDEIDQYLSKRIAHPLEKK